MHWSTVCLIFVPILAGAAWVSLRRSTDHDAWLQADPRGAELSDRIHASAQTLTTGTLLHHLPGSLESSLKRDLAELTRRLLPGLALERARWTRAVLEQPAGSTPWSAAAAALQESDVNFERLAQRLEQLELQLLAAPVGTGAEFPPMRGHRYVIATALSVSDGVELLSRRLSKGRVPPIPLSNNGLEA